jgi:RNA polymerase sigma factor (TIGR02999 family)
VLDRLPDRVVPRAEATLPRAVSVGIPFANSRRRTSAPRVARGGVSRGSSPSGNEPGRETLVTRVDDSVTGLINAWSGGDRDAGDRLFSRVYDELRAIARRLHHRRTRGGADDTLDTTALVHEVYLRLAGAGELRVENREHFFAVAVRASRQIVSNYARDRHAEKRGGTATTLPLDGLPLVDMPSTMHTSITALDEALQQLEQLHPRPCRVVECRFFGGLSIPETAAVLQLSEATVKRDWAVAQAWLHRELREQ